MALYCLAVSTLNSVKGAIAFLAACLHFRHTRARIMSIWGRLPKIISITSVLRSVTVEVAFGSSWGGFFVIERGIFVFPHITISTSTTCDDDMIMIMIYEQRSDSRARRRSHLASDFFILKKLRNKSLYKSYGRGCWLPTSCLLSWRGRGICSVQLWTMLYRRYWAATIGLFGEINVHNDIWHERHDLKPSSLALLQGGVIVRTTALLFTYSSRDGALPKPKTAQAHSRQSL